MELKSLKRQQVETIYSEHMTYDFKKDEIKPIGLILDAIEKGIYDCLGMYREECLVGYAYLVKLRNEYLLDYYAVFDEVRNEGIGGEALHLLTKYYPNASGIIIEVENPEYANDPQEKELQKRRIEFYLRNGCMDTGVRVTCFGVPFILLVLSQNSCVHEDGIKKTYEAIYREMLPPRMYREQIRIDE